MSDCSLLYEGEPVFDAYDTFDLFADLNLDQIICEITDEKQAYHLDEIYKQKPRKPSDITFRLAILKDFERPELFGGLLDFCSKLGTVVEYLAYGGTQSKQQQNEKWHLDAAMIYCRAVLDASQLLDRNRPQSMGLRRIHTWLQAYLITADFVRLHEATQRLFEEMEQIRYCMALDMTHEKIVLCDDTKTTDVCQELATVFRQFRTDAFDSEIVGFSDIGMSFFETKVLGLLQAKYKPVFERLHRYFKEQGAFLQQTLCDFRNEAQFYLTFIQYMERMKRKGFTFAYPQLSGQKQMKIVGGYDLSLAQKCLEQELHLEVVRNDFTMLPHERHFILTGPNQGGKTTYARMLGQIAYFASIGLQVPCNSAEVFFFDGLYTHFAMEEDIGSGYGRLKEELIRLGQMLDVMQENSIVFLNELFATTTSYDAYHMGKELLDLLRAKGCVCLYVTHIYKLSQVGEHTVSLVATAETSAGHQRRFVIERMPAQGVAYAGTLLEKYHLSYDDILEKKQQMEVAT